jgi:hypothetical protein
MTLLVALAMGGPMRPYTVWRNIGKKAPTALDGLIERGLVYRWSISYTRAFVALDPAHPAAAPLTGC